MVTNVKRRTRAPRAPGLPDEMREYLLTGHYFAPGKPDEAEARQHWQRHQRELLNYWAQNPDTWRRGDLSLWGYPTPAGPCHRPYAWWQYSALSEPRRMVSPDELEALENDRLGFSSVGRAQRALGNRPETDFEYLHRHSLLSAAELRWLAAFPLVTHADWCFVVS